MEFLSWIGLQFGSVAETGYREWYASLEKPFFAPEPWVFGLAWGIIYPLIACALAWTIYLWSQKKIGLPFASLFLLNIVLNLTFSATLLTSQNNLLISLHILSVLATLLWLETMAWKRSQVVFWLLVPYVLWGTFATTLQLWITFIN